MCSITCEHTGAFTGYKVAVKVGGAYYSPVTGVEYAPGKPLKTSKYAAPNVRESLCIADVLCYGSYAHKPALHGNTCVFKSAARAYELRNKWRERLKISSKKDVELVVIKMTLGKTCYAGYYGGVERKVVVGCDIVAIKEFRKKKQDGEK